VCAAQIRSPIFGNGASVERLDDKIHLRVTPLDKCEEAFGKCEWDRFGYWHAIYLRERLKSPSSPMGLR